MILTKIIITVGTGLRQSGDAIFKTSLEVMINSAKQYMLFQCGAYTIAAVDGGWRDGKIDWTEPGLSITATIDLSRTISPHRIAADIRDIFDQKCVALETYSVNFELI